jgi:hypothetical protein
LESDRNFIFITYNLPSEPSRIRVAVWRLLKREGALNMQQSLWLIPCGEHARVTAQKVKELIEKEGGSAYIVSGQFLHGSDDIIERFNGERDIEYKELLEYCEKFHHEMKEETELKNFTFAELEENEEELSKLAGWYEKIKKRDTFDSAGGRKAEQEIALCREEFEKFTVSVYECNSND